MNDASRLRPANSTEFPATAAVPAARPLSEFTVERVGDELIIFDGETMHYHTLNASASRIWRQCDGVTSVTVMAAELGMPVEIVERSIAELGEAGLLQSAHGSWDAAVSRRRAAKVVAAGLVGAVGLPVIKSITVPDAAAAVSPGQCFDIGMACNSYFCALGCQVFGGSNGGSCQTVDGTNSTCCVCN